MGENYYYYIIINNKLHRLESNLYKSIFKQQNFALVSHNIFFKNKIKHPCNFNLHSYNINPTVIMIIVYKYTNKDV